MNTLVACDLDRTLIFSRTALGKSPRAGDAENVVCVEYYQGGELSYMTPAAMALLEKLAASAVVVPATTRTVAQFRRIGLPASPYHYAVTSNGGTILVDGEPDPPWRAHVVGEIERGGPSLEIVLAELRRRISDDWVRNLRSAEDLFCYLVVDIDRTPPDFRADWAAWCAPRGWSVSQQGRKIYTVPLSLCKSHAVNEIRRRLGHDTTPWRLLAAGDGALDAELLMAADAAIRPCHGELHMLGWQGGRTTVTRHAGLPAAEELLQWLIDAATTPGDPVATGRSAQPAAGL